jgi:CDP-diacylglycerol--serine O-phosphatidyltransferase
MSRFLGFYDYTVILTYASLLSAVSSMFYASQGNYFYAVFFLMLSGLCDAFDGAVARSKKDRTEEGKSFGIQIDSLCDLVAFGALPAAIALRLGEGALLAKIGASLILLSSVIRLGFFNVQEIRRDRSQKRDVYLGMPVTLVAIFFPLCLSLCVPLNLSPATLAPYFLIAFAALEVSRIPLKKPYGVAKLFLLAVGVGVFVCVCLFGTKITL